MMLDDVVLNIRAEELHGEAVWVADCPGGVTIKVEPDNYDYWFTDNGDTVYTRKKVELAGIATGETRRYK